MKLLQIDCSPMGEAAISRLLTKEFAQRWLTANPQGTVVTRDLARNAIPVIDAAWVRANYTPKELRTHEQNQLLKLSTELIAELLDADEYVIGMPIHNWGPPSSFKLWVDHIVTPSSNSEKPLTGKHATFIIAAGRVYACGSKDASKNHVVPWLRTLFGSLGVADMQFVLVDGTRETNNGKIDRETFLAPHVEAIQAFFAEVPASVEAYGS